MTACLVSKIGSASQTFAGMKSADLRKTAMADGKVHQICAMVKLAQVTVNVNLQDAMEVSALI